MPRVVMPERVYLRGAPQAGLIILQNDGPMQRVPLGKGRTMVGRGSGNQVVIDSPAVSGRHAEIVYQGNNEYSIFDLDSLNGLTHEGRRIASKVLRGGDRLHIADQVRIQFQPALSFFTEAPGKARAHAPRQEAPRPALKLSVCVRCGATNYGPQEACLRCQARLG
jgi:pSer/pThr/pTyr-binding forkhead associated (FHA) protein